MTQQNLEAKLLESRNLDLVADYLSRGRKHEALTSRELLAGWVAASWRTQNDHTNREAEQAEADLSAEYRLRGEAPPYTLVLPNCYELPPATNARIQKAIDEGKDFDEIFDEISKRREAFKASGGRAS